MAAKKNNQEEAVTTWTIDNKEYELDALSDDADG
jgi:hypothetical protein